MFRLLICITILFFSEFVYAVEVTDLYQAEVNVSSQATQARNKAIKQAMKIVLVKVGGDESVLTNKVIKQEIKHYQQYVEQFSFTRYKSQLRLLASFNEEKINDLFHQTNLPLWGNLRPQILIWLVNEQGLTRHIISESSNTVFPEIIKQFSQTRGLPLSLPVMDLTDVNNITTADVWGRFLSPIRVASERYQAEAYVVIRLSNSSLLPQNENSNEDNNKNIGGNDIEHNKNIVCDLLCQQNNYGLDWRLFTQDKEVPQASAKQLYQGANAQDLITQALRDVTQEIYQYYALSTNDSRTIDIEVANINSLKRYQQVFTFLKNLSSVDAVKLIMAEGEKRRFRLHLLGSEKTLLASLKLSKQIQQYVDPLAGIEENTIPVFYWKK